MQFPGTSLEGGHEDEQRDAFEAALRRAYPRLLFISRDPIGMYQDAKYEDRWQGWRMGDQQCDQYAASANDEGALRRRFEADIRALNPNDTFVSRWPDGVYKHHEIEARWQGLLMVIDSWRRLPADRFLLTRAPIIGNSKNSLTS